VFAFSKTHIVLPPEFAKITMGCDIAESIEDNNDLPDFISVNTFNRLLKALTSNATEFIPKPLSKNFHLELTHIRTGLICPKCHLKITNHKHCQSCKISINLMQQQAIEDWFYLYKDSISNSECVHFLELKDKFAANYLLTKLHLDKINEHRYRRYTISQNFWLMKKSSPNL